jgi:hypothetical protein
LIDDYREKREAPTREDEMAREKEKDERVGWWFILRY